MVELHYNITGIAGITDYDYDTDLEMSVVRHLRRCGLND